MQLKLSQLPQTLTIQTHTLIAAIKQTSFLAGNWWVIKSLDTQDKQMSVSYRLRND